jgi:hypothetical protein
VRSRTRQDQFCGPLWKLRSFATVIRVDQGPEPNWDARIDGNDSRVSQRPAVNARRDVGVVADESAPELVARLNRLCRQRRLGGAQLVHHVVELCVVLVRPGRCAEDAGVEREARLPRWRRRREIHLPYRLRNW